MVGKADYFRASRDEGSRFPPLFASPLLSSRGLCHAQRGGKGLAAAIAVGVESEGDYTRHGRSDLTADDSRSSLYCVDATGRIVPSLGTVTIRVPRVAGLAVYCFDNNPISANDQRKGPKDTSIWIHAPIVAATDDVLVVIPVNVFGPCAPLIVKIHVAAAFSLIGIID